MVAERAIAEMHAPDRDDRFCAQAGHADRRLAEAVNPPPPRARSSAATRRWPAGEQARAEPARSERRLDEEEGKHFFDRQCERERRPMRRPGHTLDGF